MVECNGSLSLTRLALASPVC